MIPRGLTLSLWCITSHTGKDGEYFNPPASLGIMEAEGTVKNGKGGRDLIGWKVNGCGWGGRVRLDGGCWEKRRRYAFGSDKKNWKETGIIFGKKLKKTGIYLVVYSYGVMPQPVALGQPVVD